MGVGMKGILVNAFRIWVSPVSETIWQWWVLGDKHFDIKADDKLPQTVVVIPAIPTRAHEPGDVMLGEFCCCVLQKAHHQYT